MSLIERLPSDDARLSVARAYSFRDWTALSTLVAQIADPDSPVRTFELAAEAVISGDAATLSSMIAADPELVRARSTRETCHDPCIHRATLLHYIGANGIEGYRQRSALNAVEIARLLLDAGAEVDALADMYGGQCTTMSMLISSSPPADAGVQVPLVNTLFDFGASIDGNGVGSWVSPIRTALIFGMRDAAEAVVALLLDAGVDPNQFNPTGMHSHQTPLHSASFDGDMALVQLLVSHGTRYDIPDTLWNSTAVGWAEHGGQQKVLDWFASRAPQ